jgi:uncharacterized lipoprotein YehR (DUF1307 family)
MGNDKKETKKLLKRMRKRHSKWASGLCRSECISSENTAACKSVIIEPPKVDLDYLTKVLGSLNEQQTKFLEANKDILILTSLTHGVERARFVALRSVFCLIRMFNFSTMFKGKN